MTGRFIAFEGGEGSGKSTQAARLAERLRAVFTFEPGDTALGGAVRELLLERHSLDITPRAEALLMAADRAQHVAEVIRPALAAGRHVVCDRYVGSTLAYQGFGRGLPVDELRRLSAWAAQGLEPDVIVLLDVPRSLTASRVAGRADPAPDRVEAAGDGFHDRVAEGYRRLAAADPARWVVVDGTAGTDDVEAAVWKAVVSRCPALGTPD
ncbi:MAG: dTMP kinase [Acidimicrobiales bacterium]